MVLEPRFPTRASLPEFEAHSVEAKIQVSITSIDTPTKSDAGPCCGLSSSQREPLAYTVEPGYYSLPREIPTQELADGFVVSDQAVTERLRRGITTLIGNTSTADEASRST